MALLHHKTTHYKEVDISDYKELYEDISNNIFYLKTYYDDMMSMIESHIVMSPSEYLLARNITLVYDALNFSKHALEKWYEMIQDKRKQRMVVLHNHIELSHFIRNQNAYLTSWDKAKFGIPIFDFYKFYKKHGLEFEFDACMGCNDRLLLYSLPKETNANIIVMAVLQNICHCTRNLKIYSATEPVVCSIFTSKGHLVKLSFTFANPERLLEFYL